MQNKRRDVGTKAECRGGLLLAGTYRMECLDWILGKLRYNCPVPVESGELAFDPSAVVVISLYKENQKTLHFKAKFDGYENLSELKHDGYPVSENPHAKIYAMFALKPVAASAVAKLAAFKMNGHVPVVARLDDFALTDEERAVLSHWAHNKGDTSAKPYEKRAKDILPSDLFTRMKASSSCGCGKARPQYLFPDLFKVPFPPPENPKFTFIDLFAGIGGFRIAMQNCGGKCVFSSEWDKAAQQTYTANYGEIPFGDITKEETKNAIPEKFDVLCAGFPCQPFSLAGVSARVAANKQHGFNDKTQGTLFFDVLQIIRTHLPRVVFLENVRNLVNHDHGRTFKIIRESIEELGYSFNFRVIDASPIVPQKRVRCYMVCVRNNGRYDFPEITGEEKPLSSILESDVSESFTISDGLWAGHQRRTKNNLARGAGFTAFTADVTKPSHTLVARYYKDGKECLIPQEGKNPRMLTPRECARLQGFPERFALPKSRSAAYKQMGNSVVVPVLARIAGNIVRDVLKIKED